MNGTADLRLPAARTDSGIPIRNLWYMLLYVWDAVQLKTSWRADVENALTLDALLGSVLGNLVQQRLRIGLGRDYRLDESELAGIRGRVSFADSVKRMTFQHGRAYCRYQTFNANVPKNQIVRSTLARFVTLGEFSQNTSVANALRSRLRRLVINMDSIDVVELKPAMIRRELFRRHDADYALMLTICDVFLRRQMPTEFQGEHQLAWLDRDTLIIWQVFERFVAKFYAHHLKDWIVSAQQTLHWPAENSSRHLPGMKPDLVLEHRTTGKLLVLDTKFYPDCFVKSQYSESLKFHSSHLYQMYAYLMSQHQRSASHETASGVLLYPAVGQHVSESIIMQGHELRWETIDLAAEWPEIENGLLDLIKKHDRPAAQIS